MGIWDRFQRSKNHHDSIAPIKIGDWVTQYSAGYWMVVKFFPKYAEEDYSYNGISWKKGEHIGEWVILKKGFTPKMKPNNACELVDAKWCKTVSHDIAQAIELAFSENPKALTKFQNAPDVPNPTVGPNIWLALTEAQADSFAEHIKSLKDRFSIGEFWAWSADYQQYIVDSSKATHILYFLFYPWEIDDNFQPLHCGVSLKKL